MSAIKNYTNTTNVPEGPLLKMAKLGVVIEKWSNDQQLIGTAIQCWTSLEEFYGVVPCTIMSMSSNSLIPSACETDITGLIGMLALTAAAGKPAALVGLEQQLRHRPKHGRRVSLLELAERFFQQPEDGLSGNHCRHGGQRQHVWHDCGQNCPRTVHLLPRFDRRR